jgi:hypothetical protein
MAGTKSNYLENAILNHWLGGATSTAPANVFFALFTANPTDSGGGTEVTGGSYARVSVANNTTNFATTSTGVKSNTTAVNFPAATASWGTVVGMAVFDASSGGNMLVWADLVTAKAIASGDQPYFAAGDFTWTED